MTLSFLPTVELREEVLRLGDVADLSALPPEFARRAAAAALLRVERGVSRAAVPRRVLAAQAGARLPALAGCFDLASNAPVTIRRRIPEGMPRVAAAGSDGIGKGERVAVRIVSGPFSIERGGNAVGDAQPGQRLFVRTDSGDIVRAVVEWSAP